MLIHNLLHNLLLSTVRADCIRAYSQRRSQRLPPSPSWHLTLLWPCLERAVSWCTLPDQLLLDHLVSLGPWCFLLRLATLHPSQLARVRIFLRSQRRIQLCGPCLVDHGRLDAFTASFTVPRVSADWLFSWFGIVLSPELDCSGRCLAKRLHEPCFEEHCTNSTPVKLLITRSIKPNNVRSLSGLTRILLNQIVLHC